MKILPGPLPRGLSDSPGSEAALSSAATPTPALPCYVLTAIWHVRVRGLGSWRALGSAEKLDTAHFQA